MEKIRTHKKSHRAGEVKIDPTDRIFNPSRQTDYLLSKAKSIGPNTRRLCDLLFEEQGRIGHRRMQGIVNLIRRYEVCHIEQTAHEAIEMGLRSYKAFCRLVDVKKKKESQKSVDAAGVVKQEHELIRPATDYGEFFDQYAATTNKKQDIILSQEQLPTEQKPIVAVNVKSNPENKPISVDLRPFLGSCQYLGCGYLPERPPGQAQSPLNGRVVFQVRGVVEEGPVLKSVILSHIGRALTDQQEATDGKYWGFPFHKRLEIYNQDKLLMDHAAKEQVKEFGLILVEGFFDVAALVEVGCLNVGALMGAHITKEQIDRLKFINAHVPVPRITLFLDRDEAGRQGTKRAALLLEQNGFVVTAFDWDYVFTRPGLPPCRIGPHIKDPGDLSFTQIKWLRKQGMI
jgi:5S rRNA maturation endonuclease (ribonuclease M5)